MRPQTIEGTRHDQLFHHPTVQLLGVGSGAQVEQILEIALLTAVTRLDDRLDRPLPYPLDGADTVDDLAFIIDVEVVLPTVDVRR